MIDPVAAAVLAGSPAAGWSLARIADHLAGRTALGTGWMIAGAVAAAAASLAVTPMAAVQTVLLGWALLVLAAVDGVALRLPDAVTLPLAAAGLLDAVASGGDLAERLLGALAGGLALLAVREGYRRLRHRTGLGLGDVKLFAAAGAWLGWTSLASVLLLAAAAGLAWGAVRLLSRGGSSLAEPLPFGVPLALAFWLAWLEQAGAGEGRF